MNNEVNPHAVVSLNEMLKNFSDEQWSFYQNLVKDIPYIAMGDREVEMEMKIDAAQCVLENIRG